VLCVVFPCYRYSHADSGNDTEGGVNESLESITMCGRCKDRIQSLHRPNVSLANGLMFGENSAVLAAFNVGRKDGRSTISREDVHSQVANG
jgi:hypothetical protein